MISDGLKQLKAKSDNQNDRIIQIELLNQHQDEEIKYVKRDMSGYRNKMDPMKVDK